MEKKVPFTGINSRCTQPMQFTFLQRSKDFLHFSLQQSTSNFGSRGKQGQEWVRIRWSTKKRVQTYLLHGISTNEYTYFPPLPRESWGQKWSQMLYKRIRIGVGGMKCENSARRLLPIFVLWIDCGCDIVCLTVNRTTGSGGIFAHAKNIEDYAFPLNLKRRFSATERETEFRDSGHESRRAATEFRNSDWRHGVMTSWMT